MFGAQFEGFLEAVRSDSDLRLRVEAAGDEYVVAALAQKAGFVISTDEIKSAVLSVSDEELASAAGGGPSLHIAERLAGEYPSKNPALAARQAQQSNHSDWTNTIGSVVTWLAVLA